MNHHDTTKESLPSSQSVNGKTKVVVASTVMLSFISFWRAAAIVLNDLGSSAYYVPGIAEQAIGKAAPWFILAIMLFSYAVRAVYIESCSMFVRGGVYRVVHEAMGGTLAKFSVSALMFDYVLTGPISGVSAGLYLSGLINELGVYLQRSELQVEPNSFAVGFAVLITVYFWRKNIIGIPESSEKALRIMQITTTMIVILIVWGVLTIVKVGHNPVPWPTPENLHLSDDALGWLKRYLRAFSNRSRDNDRTWSFAARHERGGEHGAGLSGNGGAKIEESRAGGIRHLPLQFDFHCRSCLPGDLDHARRRASKAHR